VSQTQVPSSVKPRACLAMVSVLAAVFTASAPGRADAGFVQVDSNSLSNLAGGASLSAQGVVYSEFRVLGAFADGDALPPNPAAVTVQAGFDSATALPGLGFVLSLTAAPLETVNLQILFRVTAPAAAPIEGVTLNLFGSSTTGSGMVTIAETVLDRPLGAMAADLANLGVANLAGTQFDVLTDHAELSAVTREIWILKDISVTGRRTGTAHLSRFEQYYHVVPEPSVIALLASALAGFMACRRRRPRPAAD
jgi:hypothetical protein